MVGDGLVSHNYDIASWYSGEGYGRSRCGHHWSIHGLLEPGEDKNNSGHCNNYTHHDSHGHHIALVLPIGNLTGSTRIAKEGMGTHYLTVSAWSCDGAEHS